MKSLTITDAASRDLDSIATWLEDRHAKTAARRVASALIAAMRALAFRNTGRYGRIDGTYEKTITGLPYIIVYRCTDNAVEILRIIHTSRNWPVKEG